MKCETASEAIMKYFDRELNDIETGQLKQHLKCCETCSREFEELESVLGPLEELEKVTPPEGFETVVMNRIKTMQLEQKKRMDQLLILMYGVASFLLLGMTMSLVAYLQEISLLQVVGKLTVIFNTLIQIAQALSVTEAGIVAYGVLIVAFAIILGYTGIIVFMDTNMGGIGNESEK